jgi:hypothetical protein
MDRTELVEKAEKAFGRAEASLEADDSALSWASESARMWIELGQGYIGLARLADA